MIEIGGERKLELYLSFSAPVVRGSPPSPFNVDVMKSKPTDGLHMSCAFTLSNVVEDVSGDGMVLGAGGDLEQRRGEGEQRQRGPWRFL